MEIEISGHYLPGSFYRSSTEKSGWYRRWRNKNIEEVLLSPAKDFVENLRNWGEPSCPIQQPRNKIIVVFPLEVETGFRKTNQVIGRAAQFINVVGTVQARDPMQEFVAGDRVKLSAFVFIDGSAETEPSPGLPPPAAELKAKFSVEELGELGGEVSINGTQTETRTISGKLGIHAAISPVPGMGGSAEIGGQGQSAIQGVPYGYLVVNDHMDAMVQVNQYLIWKFHLIMTARNHGADSTMTNAKTRLKNAFLHFKLIPIQRSTGPGYGPAVQIFSGGQIIIINPSVPLGTRYGETELPQESFQILQSSLENPEHWPKLQFIVENGEFIQEDGLLGSLLQFSGIQLRRRDVRGGKAFFTDGTLNFVDSEDPNKLLGYASLTDIFADAGMSTFSAQVTRLELVELAWRSSRYAQALRERSGRIEFDPGIIQASDLFSKDAVSYEPFYLEMSTGLHEVDTMMLAAEAVAEETLAKEKSDEREMVLEA